MNDVKTSLIPVEALQKIDEALNFARSVQVVKIISNGQYEQSTKLFRELGGYIKAIDAERVRVKQPYLDQGRQVDQYFKDPAAVLSGLKSKLDPAIREYEREIERKRIEEQNRLNAIAEENRRKVEAAAQAERDKAEEKRREADRIRQEDAARAEELDRQAAAAEVRADTKEQKAEQIVAPIAQTALPKAEGISKRANWKMEVTDPGAFVDYCISKGEKYLLMPNEKACKAYAGTMRRPMDFPGARIFNDESLTGRAM
jgi:hypothetical protein